MRVLSVFAALMVALLFGTPIQAQQYHYVDGLDPQGDNWLALRSEPSGSRGYRIEKLGPGTLLQKLGQSGTWIQVRTAAGQVGWAHSRWVFCCRSATTSPSVPARQVSTASCEDLWYQRNAIWHKYGYCFKTAKGKQTFGNEGCVRSLEQARAMMDQTDSDRIDQIFAAEKAQGCR